MADVGRDRASAARDAPTGRRRRTSDGGPGRALAAAYAVFALAAGARSAVQIATRFDDAPLPYLLSAFAAVVYLLGTVCLRREGRAAARVAVGVCAVELCGVLVVGTWSRLDGSAFGDQTVWSDFGGGYGHVPVVLPLLGLWWLLAPARRTRLTA